MSRGVAPGRHARTASWAVQILLGFAMVSAGVSKLIGEDAMIDLFDDIGVGQWLRFVVGALEVAGAVGLFVRRMRVLAAAGLFVVMLGALITNLFVIDENPASALVFMLMAAAIVFLRRNELPTWKQG